VYTLVHGMRGRIQGHSAQAVCNDQHLILAARDDDCLTGLSGPGARCSAQPAANWPPPASRVCVVTISRHSVRAADLPRRAKPVKAAVVLPKIASMICARCL